MLSTRRRKVSSRIPDGCPLPFQLTTELARNKNSVVFEATPVDAATLHPSTKPIPPHHATLVVKAFVCEDSKKGLQKCRAEARALRSSAHPYVCEFLGRYSQNGRHFLAVKHYEEDLFSLAFPSPLRGPELSEQECLLAFTKIVLALDHMHSKGVVHCDVKLENVFVSRDTVALGDFGLAKKFDSSTRRTFGPGTVLYSAPETHLGLKVKGPEIDVWAAGVLLYLLIEGFFPFDGTSSLDVINAITSCGGIPEYSCASDDTRALISSMLEANPANRISIADIKELPIIAAIVEALPAPASSPKKSAKSDLASAALFLAPIKKTLGSPCSPRRAAPSAAPLRSKSARSASDQRTLQLSCTPPPQRCASRRYRHLAASGGLLVATRARSDTSSRLQARQ